MSAIEIGKLLRSSTNGCVIGCRVSELNAPSLGALVRAPLDEKETVQAVGLIYDIHIDDDGLVRQLITAREVSQEVILDNRMNRNVPVEISVLFVGHLLGGDVYHLLPPRPPLTLDAIYLCTDEELRQFTSSGRFGYFRHILRASDLPTGELLAAHIRQVAAAQSAAGNAGWLSAAVQELIVLLRDDYPALMSVLGALGDTGLQFDIIHQAGLGRGGQS
ncbi:MAG: hypothetical protein HPY45_00285 [Anaerolineae bacterium]|nr:hypothetical protein [Anaerolineae bacterium]